MSFVLVIIILAAIESSLYLPFVWRFRRYAAWFVIGCTGFVCCTQLAAFFKSPAIIVPSTVLILILGLYRLFNLLRIIKNRLHPNYLYASARRCSWSLIGLQFLVILVDRAIRHERLSSRVCLGILAIIIFIINFWLFITTRRSINRSQAAVPAAAIASRDLPSLTVVIPARNETAELERCLRSLVTSSYQKLEIIVLDDSSQNKRTPEIIRSFAQQGVRFMPGAVPPDDWLAKNFAYKQLAKAANGELILFCGVDVFFEPHSLTNFVKKLQDSAVDMLCLMPINQLPPTESLSQMLVQPMRYGWEVALPRELLGRPPVLSSCWLIRRSALIAAGGLAAVSRKIIPESYFARQADRAGGYKFAAASPELAVTSSKNFTEQRSTALRVRYPQLHKRPELVALISLLELTLFILPFGLIIAAELTHDWLAVVLGAGSIIVNACLYIKLVKITYRQLIFSSLWTGLAAVLYDIWLLNRSMCQYEFSEVLWKGRNVCLPVMHTGAEQTTSN